MKKRYLLTLPLVALLASCGAGQDAAAKVKQSLPKEETVVSSEDEHYADYVDEIVNGVLNMAFSGVMYEARIDLDVSAKAPYYYEETSKTLSEKISVHGDFKFGFQANDLDGTDFYLGFENLSLNVDLTLPHEYVVVDEEGNPKVDEDGYEQYAMEFINIKFAGSKLYASLLGTETAEGAIIYGDCSSHALQEVLIKAITKALLFVEMPMNISAETMLDLLIGPRPYITDEEGFPVLDDDDNIQYTSEYRKGKFKLNVSEFLDDINSTIEEEEDKIPAAIVANPFSYGLFLAKMELYNVVSEELPSILPMISAMLPALGGKVGTVLDEEGKLTEGSLLLNTSVKDACKKLGMPEEDIKNIPVSGNAGVVITVGTNNGSEGLAFEHLGLASEMKVSQDRGSASLSLSVKVNAVYNDQVEFPSISAEEALDYDYDLIQVALAIYTMLTYEPEVQ